MSKPYPLPVRAVPVLSPEELETGDHPIAWAKGETSDGRPYWIDFWFQGQVKMLTIYLSSEDLNFGEGHDLQDELPMTIGSADTIILGDQRVAQDFLEKEGLIKFKEKSFVSPCRFSDDNGDFWSINIVAGDENEVYCESQVMFHRYGQVDPVAK